MNSFVKLKIEKEKKALSDSPWCPNDHLDKSMSDVKWDLEKC